LTAHYRSDLVFTFESLQAAQNALFTLREHVRKLSEDSESKGERATKAEEYRKDFLEAVNDDLNMPKSLTVVWKLVRDEKEVSNRQKCELLQEFDRVLALDLAREVTEEKLPREVEELVRKREAARKNREWKTADKLREEVRELGYIIEDTSEGVRWRRAISEK
jgi:cysteinyl-tRNA synthetase